MDFNVFDRTEIENMYSAVISRMTDTQKNTLAEEFGDLRTYETHFMEKAAEKQVQKNWEKVTQWYGALAGGNSEITEAYERR